MRLYGCKRLGLRALLVVVWSLAGWLVHPSESRACSCGGGSGAGFLSQESGRLPANAAGVLWEGFLLTPPPGFVVADDQEPQLGIVDRAEGVPLAVEAIPLGLAIAFRGVRVEPPAEDREEPPEKGTDDPYPTNLFAIRPEGGFQPGHTYVFRYNPNVRLESVVPSDGENASLRAEGAFALPEGDVFLLPKPPRKPVQQLEVTIDEATVGGTFDVELGAGSPVARTIPIAGGAACSFDMPARVVEIEVLPDPVAPYAPYLYYETFVDGAPWIYRQSLCSTDRFGSSGRGPAKDLLHSVGQSPDGMRLFTKHGVIASIRARLPGTDLIVKSSDRLVLFHD